MNKIQQCVFLVNSAIQIEMAVFITLYDGLILDVDKLKAFAIKNDTLLKLSAV